MDSPINDKGGRMNVGDLVQLRSDPNAFYDWGSIPPRKERGFYLRDPNNMNLLNEKVSGRTVDFRNTDLCIVLEVRRNHVVVLNPRFQTGLIHADRIEVISER